jgi:hypothetical protein
MLFLIKLCFWINHPPPDLLLGCYLRRSPQMLVEVPISGLFTLFWGSDWHFGTSISRLRDIWLMMGSSEAPFFFLVLLFCGTWQLAQQRKRGDQESSCWTETWLFVLLYDLGTIPVLGPNYPIYTSGLEDEVLGIICLVPSSSKILGLSFKRQESRLNNKPKNRSPKKIPSNPHLVRMAFVIWALAFVNVVVRF